MEKVKQPIWLYVFIPGHMLLLLVVASSAFVYICSHPYNSNTPYFNTVLKLLPCLILHRTTWYSNWSTTMQFACLADLCGTQILNTKATEPMNLARGEYTVFFLIMVAVCKRRSLLNNITAFFQEHAGVRLHVR
jgi:hypothetical protein